MKLPHRMRSMGRRLRAAVMPFGGVVVSLAKQTRRTSLQFNFSKRVTDELVEGTRATCHELGWIDELGTGNP